MIFFEIPPLMRCFLFFLFAFLSSFGASFFGISSSFALSLALPDPNALSFSSPLLPSHQNEEITLSRSFDGISVSGDGETNVSFDEGKTWHRLERSDDNDADDAFISELFLTEHSKKSFRFTTNSKTPLVFHFVFLSEPSNIYAGPVQNSIGYTRDEAFFQKLGIVKRENWGADESLRFVVPTPTPLPTPTPDPSLPTPTPSTSWKDVQCDQWQDKYPEDFTTSSTVYYENGNLLEWGHRYSPSIKKFVIHHTAESVESLASRTESQTMQAIYVYHAKSKGWGDIGYHFVIGPSGKIYEAKAGGDFVVAGHTYCANAQTIGIALMGNFETQNPSVEQLKALETLLKGLSEKYNLPINAQTSFHGKNTANIVGHKDYGATACPGKFLYALLPNIQTGTVDYEKLTMNMVGTKEILKASIQGEKIIRQFAKKESFHTTQVAFKNTGNTPWKSSEISLEMKYLGQKKTIVMNESIVKPGEIAHFSLTSFSKIEKNQNYTVTLKKQKKNILGGRAKWKISPLDTPLFTPSPLPTFSNNNKNTTIRIKLSAPKENTRIEGNAMKIEIDGKEIEGGVSLDIAPNGENLLINGQIETSLVRISSPLPLTVSSWKRIPEWDASLNDNMFRGVLEVRMIDGVLTIINELAIEDYLKGVAEVSNTAPVEKQKAMAVIARSYALFYTLEENRKYPNKPYDGDDSPESFQKYLGYGYEKRSPEFSKSVESTEGKVLTFQGSLIKTPYFSESDGRTRSAKEVWKWEDTPYLKAVDDTMCKNGKGTLKGHGVGLSGCGAESMALSGSSFEEILKYYYTGVEVTTKNEE